MWLESLDGCGAANGFEAAVIRGGIMQLIGPIVSRDISPTLVECLSMTASDLSDVIEPRMCIFCYLVASYTSI